MDIPLELRKIRRDIALLFASIGSITIDSTAIITALGFTPVTNTRTLTINGTAQDLSANRSWTITTTPDIRRNANNSSNSNINYCGYAPSGSTESSTVWTVKKLTITSNGSVTITSATNVAWTNRESATYT